MRSRLGVSTISRDPSSFGTEARADLLLLCPDGNSVSRKETAMRRPICVLLCSIVGTSAAAAPVPQQSWGKAGISFDQYRQDAIECGREGYYLDISQTADAKELVRASRRLD